MVEIFERVIFLLILTFRSCESDSMSVKITDKIFNDSVGLIYDQSTIEIRCECISCTNVKILDPNGQELEMESVKSSDDMYIARITVNENTILGEYKCVSNHEPSYLKIPYRLCPASDRNCSNSEQMCIYTEKGRCENLTRELCKEVHNAKQSFLFFSCKRQLHSPRHYDSLCEGVVAHFKNNQPLPVVETKNLLSRVCSPYQPYETFTMRILEDKNMKCDMLNDSISRRIPVGSDYHLEHESYEFSICVQCKPFYKIDICFSIDLTRNVDDHPSFNCPNDKPTDVPFTQVIKTPPIGSTIMKYVLYSRLQQSNNDESRSYFFIVVMNPMTEIRHDKECTKLNCSFIYVPPSSLFSTSLSWLIDEEYELEAEQTTQSYSIVLADTDGKYTCASAVRYQRILDSGIFEETYSTEFTVNATCRSKKKQSGFFKHLAIVLIVVLLAIVVAIVAYCLLARYNSKWGSSSKTSSTFSISLYKPQR